MSVVFMSWEENESWISRDSEIVTKICFNCAVNLTDVDKNLLSTVFLPSWSQALAVTTPWSVKLDKPPLVTDSLLAVKYCCSKV